jgi:transcriptional regulator with XRE-family HTH domain
MAGDVFTRRLGARIKALRDARKLTQAQLGEKVGIGLEYASSIERGRKGATIATLAKLAAELGVTLSELFLGVDKPLPKEMKRLETALAGKSPDAQRQILRILADALNLAKEPDS